MKRSKEAFTYWKSARHLIDSEYGSIPFKRWCELEAERLNKDPSRSVCVVKNAFGKVALAE